jgi:1-phosphofructokinase family hexose kinase
MIFCILLNPTIDKIVEIVDFSSGNTYNLRDISVFPVGKAISVALTLSTLECPVQVVCLIGENQVPLYEKFLQNHNIPAHIIPIKGQTRSNLTIIDQSNKLSTHLRFPGFKVTSHDLEQIDLFLDAHVNKDDYVVFSGSLPNGAPPEYFFKPAEIVNRKSARLIIDTSGDRLKPMLLYNPYLIKANLDEMSSILDKNLVPSSDINKSRELDHQPSLEELYTLLDSCGELYSNKSKLNIITLAQYGALAFNRKGSYYAKIKSDNNSYTIGCGDAFLGGLISGMSKNLSDEECLKFATACGAANTLTLGPGILKKSDVNEIMTKIIIKRLK